MSFAKAVLSSIDIGTLIQQLEQLAASGIGYGAKVLLSHQSIPAPVAITGIELASEALGQVASAVELNAGGTPSAAPAPVSAMLIAHPMAGVDATAPAKTTK